MKIPFKSLFLLFLGSLIGFTIVAVIDGIPNNDFDWMNWVQWMIGATIAFLVFWLFLVYQNRKN
ncbi:hypothetical protein [Salirhabdus sp. Marseille-P4669]|uniref:hypothetical protein n=1 Tax=Salirhabdus sp. Marseille-P4669 TaxID=2042310 RepID=UPI000C7C128C|nr:hypothetical protein [Salirhabdus sp. Marseille-P4669]